MRAATRVLLRARSGQIARWDVSAYLQHLADMDATAEIRDFRALHRIARRRAICSAAGALPPFRLSRRAAESAVAHTGRATPA